MTIFVNGVEISDDQVGAEMQYHSSSSSQEASYRAAQALVIRELLLQQAEACDLIDDVRNIKTEDEGELIDQLLSKQVSVPTADEGTCLHYYDSHPNSFMKEGGDTRLPFVEAQPYIIDYLHTRSMRLSVAEYIKALSNNAKIEGIKLVESER